MKRVCFITMGNIYMAPYISTYIHLLNNRFSVICWDREGREESLDNCDIYVYRNEQKGSGIFGKIRGYLEYRKFIKKVLSENHFDVIILLQTWCAILINDILIKNYKGKYIVDIRDYTYEKIFLIKCIEKKTFKHAGMCVVSSEGYKEFLPNNDYYITHNLRELDTDVKSEIRTRNKNKEQLNIAFIGYVLYQEQSKKLLYALKNDERFLISFIGTRALELSQFCKENDIRNVRLIDTFDSKDILEYYKDVDIVNNLYGNNTPILDYALSNKLYFAAELSMPILVCPGTYMQKVSEKYNMAITVRTYDDSLADYIWNEYSRIDWEKLANSSNDFLSVARQEQKEYLDKVYEMVN